MPQHQAKILALAVKTAKRGPMRELDRADVTVEDGIIGGPKPSANRGMTLLALDKWNDALREAGADLHWHARRANVLLDGVDLPSLIGRRIRLGEVELLIGGETKPCPRMDEAHPGLQEVMRPDCRGGVYGRILTPGKIKAGDPLTVLDEP
jgi:MOSC domain-containing protein YiiM